MDILLIPPPENAIFALKSYVQPFLSFKTFDSQISPITEYASEIWFSNKTST